MSDMPIVAEVPPVAAPTTNTLKPSGMIPELLLDEVQPDSVPKPPWTELPGAVVHSYFLVP